METQASNFNEGGNQVAAKMDILRQINLDLYSVLGEVFNAYISNVETGQPHIEFDEKYYSWINDDLDIIKICYLGEEPDGDNQELLYKDRIANQTPLLSNIEAYDLLTTRLSNTYIHTEVSLFDAFICPALKEHTREGNFNYNNLAFDVELNGHTGDWELSIISTSMSEIDGNGEGILGTYLYNSQLDAEVDIETITSITGCQFDKV